VEEVERIEVREASSVRIPDSHKNAFWIYGVTAMIMQGPLSVVVRGISSQGIGDRAVQVETLRLLVVFLILSRQFLSAGVFFDQVYLQPDAATKFPSRSYPVDFLMRLTELLVAVAASTAVGLDPYPQKGLATFTILAGILLLLESLWLGVARSAGFSTASLIAPAARANVFGFLLCVALYVGARWAGFEPWIADVVVLCALILFTAIQLAGQVRTYGRPL
jgi:hypothetical protein